VIAFLSAANVAALVALGAIVSLLATPLGRYLAGVFGDVEPNADGTAGRRPGDRVFAPIERAIFRACRIDPDSEQRWSTYAIALLAFSAVAVLVTYAIQRLQGHLPSPGTPRSASRPTRTGRRTRASRRCRTSPR
jgi:K+-transporting ATPase ATPase A chain